MSHKLVSLLFTLLIATVLILPSTVLAQYESDELPAVERYQWQPTMLVDCPTAGTLKRASYNVSIRSYPAGGVLGAINIGLSNRLMLGISYGAQGIIAEERPIWNPRVEFNVKLSIVDETIIMPAISAGFCSQGFGAWHNVAPKDITQKVDRYTFKSKGFYVVGSKSYTMGQFQTGLHGGLNYSTEQEDNDENISFFLGLDTRLNRDIGLVLEYDFATNDDINGGSFGRGNGYLNGAIQWVYADNLVMEFLFKNLTNNRKDASDIWRGLQVTYVEYF
ncbi:MAG: hypothetical protein KAR42_02095 [candidate division Zixibacteria bacterium]|nr:hypothetical protein [candidate division Zixibacteria bacterium]